MTGCDPTTDPHTPDDPDPLAPGAHPVAEQLVTQAAQALLRQQRSGTGHGRALYRVVKMPSGGLHPVATGSGNVRGFGRQGSRISGHAEFRRVRTGTISPTLALSVVSAALGAYWQQQLDATLRDIQASLDGIRARLDLDLDAQLDLAERVLGEHEATTLEGRYEPPASVTDGLKANLVERRHLERLLTRLESIDPGPMPHRDYHSKVLTIDEQRLDEHLYRALRGLLVELRVLRLKRLGGRFEPSAYHAELDRQQDALHKQLGVIEQLLGAALQIDGSRRADRRRLEHPAARQRRQRRELRHTIRSRRQLRALRVTAGALIAALTPPAPTDQPIELLVGSVDGQPRGSLPTRPTPAGP